MERSDPTKRCSNIQGLLFKVIAIAEVFTYKALKRFLAISEKLEGLCYELKDLYKLNGVLLGLKVALTVINITERLRIP